MTVAEIKAQVMFQTNNDTDDLEDFLPHLLDYINDAYDRLVYAWNEAHPGVEPMEYSWLNDDNDEPDLPEWTHRGLVDWATWLIYRNGNVNKQQRGMQFKNAFEELLRRIANENGAKGKVKNFFNIPK